MRQMAPPICRTAQPAASKGGSMGSRWVLSTPVRVTVPPVTAPAAR